MTPRELVANLLAEVKLAEKRLAKAQEALAPVADRIRAALRAGDRPAAETLARAYEERKEDVARAEQAVAQAKEEFEAGKKRAAGAEQAARTLKHAQALGAALGGVNQAMQTAKAADDMLERLEQDTALSDARLEVLLQEAEGKLPPEAPAPPPSTAEDILKEFE
jgi:hypothetical protein